MKIENWCEMVARQYFPYLAASKDRSEFTDAEIAQRRDSALHNALNTPPKPHKPTIPKKKKRGASAKR